MQKQAQSPIKMIEDGIKKLLSSDDQKVKQKVLHELNAFRKDPTVVVPYLSKRKQNFSLQPPCLILFSQYHPHKGLTTKQGQAPINQLIGTLYSRDKMPFVLQNEFLTIIANQIVQSFEKAKSLQQIKLTQTMAKHLRNELNNCEQYNFVEKISCLIGLGFDKEPFEPLLSLLIDDGSSIRKNRQNMLNKNLRFVGIATNLLSFKPELRACVYLFTNNITKK